jgi:hypothetical protein
MVLPVGLAPTTRRFEAGCSKSAELREHWTIVAPRKARGTERCQEMERAPGLAPGKSGIAIRRLDGFGIARVWFVKGGGRRESHPDLLGHIQKL